MPVLRGESPDYTLRILKELLQTAVPLWTIRFKDLSWEDLKRIMRESEKVLEESGEFATFAQFKKGETAKAFNAIAKAIAALSFVPQGIDIFGLHFEARHEGAEGAVASNRPRDITFEKGTVGRLVLMRGLRIESTPVAENPLLGNDPWKGMANHFVVRIIDRDDRELITHFSMGTGHVDPPDIEHVLEAIGNDALDTERAEGSVERYADMLGYNPDDPDVEEAFRSEETQAAALRIFLGKDGYEELLRIAEEAI